MLCPSLPQTDYDAFSKSICEAIRAEKCEHVWAEVINVRDKSFERTKNALMNGGFANQAELLKSVSDGTAQGQQNWENYARSTFEAHKKFVPLGKLRFLQYTKPASASYWLDERENGAVLVGTDAEQMGICNPNVHSAPDYYYATSPAPADVTRTEKPLEPPLSPGQKAWRTMRLRYTPEEIKARCQAAAIKAHETMRNMRQP
jgi:hypothetical protein